MSVRHDVLDCPEFRQAVVESVHVYTFKTNMAERKKNKHVKQIDMRKWPVYKFSPKRDEKPIKPALFVLANSTGRTELEHRAALEGYAVSHDESEIETPIPTLDDYAAVLALMTHVRNRK